MTLDELRARATLERDGYRVFDGELAQMAVTLEDAEFLYALVRVTKPRRVLELGTGLGVSARFIGEALAENGDGMLWTVESNAEYQDAAEPLLTDLPVRIGTSIGSLGIPDLVFIDSGWERREADLDRWVGDQNYRGLIVVHDAARQYPQLHKGAGTLLCGGDGIWVGYSG